MPITEIAEKEVGRVIVANIVALGIIARLTGAVTKEAVESAILSRVPKGTEEFNLQAFNTGFEKAQQLAE
jgi:2-oxoglutarate ferredoxin oxidoreductase subunit gamma